VRIGLAFSGVTHKDQHVNLSIERFHAKPEGPLMKHAIVTVVLLQVPGTLAAQEFREACLPPVLPDTNLPQEVLLQYHQELSIEFEAYFRATTAYIACLDAERAAVMGEAQAAAEAYAEFLNVATNGESE
jgi:hypothetical protein